MFEKNKKSDTEEKAEKDFDIERGYTKFKAQRVLTDILTIMLSVGIGALIVIINMLII